MANLYLSFSFEKKHGLVLRITEQGQTNGSRVKVKNLVNPDFTAWNKKGSIIWQIIPVFDQCYKRIM